jgi:uncharacterized protein (TIGR03083 family)
MSDPQYWTQADLLAQIDRGWNALLAYLATLTPAQMTGPTDAAGWTVKDHVMHLAVWEKGIVALLNGEDRREAMGLDEAAWDSHDYDVMNAVIRDREAGRSLDGVMQALHDVHAQLVARIRSLSDADLNAPYQRYAPDSDNTHPVVDYITGNSFEHYAEHRPWIEQIVAV